MLRNPYAIVAIVTAASLMSLLVGQISKAGQVSGGGVVIDPDDPSITGRFGISAQKSAGGTAKGEIQWVRKIDGQISAISHVRVDCILLLDSNTALVGGTVVLDSDPSYIGTTAIVGIRDNGQGLSALPDERTSILYSLEAGFELDCDTVAFLISNGVIDVEDFLQPVKSGNFQVSP
ncbi:hypothetical protein NG895_09045 [Aeoliella sp. ICT_H6.2]|uniref:Uncharacterized protein n=1 Tax=Aeoliella straminimaris TaxID=2954799 RepID=A0A9X2JIL6_9BACT|nr:hypothetical protein [Aeoliella straminimaris]MCO6044054.1 hypothetical protein [Aeoliella straminimaris]